MSTARTCAPPSISRRTRCPPMKPPAPVTSTGLDTTVTLTRKPAPPRQQLEVGPDHEADQLFEARPRLPAEVGPRLREVADQMVDLRGADEALIELHVALPIVDTGLVERDLHALAHRV